MWVLTRVSLVLPVVLCLSSACSYDAWWRQKPASVSSQITFPFKNINFISVSFSALNKCVFKVILMWGHRWVDPDPVHSVPDRLYVHVECISVTLIKHVIELTLSNTKSQASVSQWELDQRRHNSRSLWTLLSCSPVRCIISQLMKQHGTSEYIYQLWLDV